MYKLCGFLRRRGARFVKLLLICLYPACSSAFESYLSKPNPAILHQTKHPTFDTTKATMSKIYGNYQNEIYGKGVYLDTRQTVSTDPRLLEQQAKNALSQKSFDFVAGGAGEKATMDANRLAFRQWKLCVLFYYQIFGRYILYRL